MAGAEKLNAALSLLASARDTLASVERDTHYGLHDGDYVVAYGEPRLAFMKDYDDCTCTLCSIRRFLCESEGVKQ